MSASVSSTESNNYIVVGVVGHIDHGKTSLVGRLTGVDTDTNPEEKRRGITIDLGFAVRREKELTFAFVDAPGHQKYIGNLLAGVSGVDVGLLVVAADQGIQAQTLEHVSVLQRLQIPQLVVALTRCDLCDSEQIQEITEEIQFFLSDFGFREFPVIETSATTGDGYEALTASLKAAAAAVAANRRKPQQTQMELLPFRMPIDRVLNVPGRGLVVAGTPWSGAVRVGDQVQIAGSGETYRIRHMESHGRELNISLPRVRTAFNLSGSDSRKDIKRGAELIAEDAFSESERVLLEISLDAQAEPIRCPAILQLHTAATSVQARILGVRSVVPPVSTVVIAELQPPIVAVHGQPVLLRKPYPIGTIGGGRVLSVCDPCDFPCGRPTNHQLVRFGKELAVSTDPSAKLAAFVHLVGECPIDEHKFIQSLGVLPSQLNDAITQLIESGTILQLGQLLVSPYLVKKVADYVVKFLSQHAETADDAWLVQSAVLQRCRHMASEPVVLRAIEELLQTAVDQPAIVEFNGRLAARSEQTSLSKKQRRNLTLLLAACEGKRMPPTSKELAEKLQLNLDAVNSLLRHAAQQGFLIDVGQGFYFSAVTFELLMKELWQLLAAQPVVRVPEVKDAWGLTRKHAIPLLEFCDQQAWTIRDGDVRTVGPKLIEFADTMIAAARNT